MPKSFYYNFAFENNDRPCDEFYLDDVIELDQSRRSIDGRSIRTPILYFHINNEMLIKDHVLLRRTFSVISRSDGVTFS